MDSAASGASPPPQRAVGRLVLLLVLGTGAGIGGYTMWHRHQRTSISPDTPNAATPSDRLPPDGPGEWRAPAGYVGSEACQACHRDQFTTFLATSHSRALTPVDPEREPDDAIVEHDRSGRRYKVTRREGLLVHEEFLKLEGETDIPQSGLPARWRVGSGHFGRTYLCESDGFLVESPLTWYEPRHAWGMSPGYDTPVHHAFTRMVPENCLLCHAGRIEKNSHSDYQLRLAENSIGCERCHGPGEAHIAWRQGAATGQAAGEDPMVNPGNLSRALSQAVCEQCHLQGDIHVSGRGTQPADYRPGHPLEEFRLEYRVRRPMRGMTIVGHVEQMSQSACFRNSDTLTCVTCHEPHGRVAPEDRAAHFRTVCLNCHDSDRCRSPAPNRAAKDDNCAACHMPRAETEIPHVAFTHHHIGIHPLQQEFAEGQGNYTLIPISNLANLSTGDRERAEALGYAQMCQRLPAAQADSPSGLEFRRNTAQLLASLTGDAVDAAVEVTRAEFAFRNGDRAGAITAAQRALEEFSLNTDEAVRTRTVLGYAAMQRNDFEAAREQFLWLTRLRRDAKDWHQLGLCENNLGDVPAALRALEQACVIDPASIGSYEARAVILEARQDETAARPLRELIAQLKRWSAQRSAPSR